MSIQSNMFTEKKKTEHLKGTKDDTYKNSTS